MELTIDDRTIEANRGESVLQAALRHGIEIPHFCYHPRLSIAGSCRICLVKVEGVPKLMPACNLSVAPNMKVSTLVPEVGRARRAGDAVPHAQSPGGLRDLRQGGRMPPAGLRISPTARRARARPTRSITSASCTTSARASSSTTSAASSAAAACASRARSRSRTCSASSSAARTRSSSASIRVRRRPVLGQRHRPVPDGRPAVARLPLPEPRVVSRAGAFGVHGLLARLQHRSVAAQEGVAAALARRGAQQHAVPRHRPREPRDQRSLALQQGLRPAQADEQGADADAHARRRAGIDRAGARPGPRPDRASAQSGRPRLGARLQRGARRLQGDARRALPRLRARGQRRRSPGRWSRTTS